jgi:hypothetical protein
MSNEGHSVIGEEVAPDGVEAFRAENEQFVSAMFDAANEGNPTARWFAVATAFSEVEATDDDGVDEGRN